MVTRITKTSAKIKQATIVLDAMELNVSIDSKLKNFLRDLPYPIKTSIKILIAPKYYLRILSNDIRARFGYRRSGVRIIFIAGLPKSGTTWVENFVSHIPGYNPRVLSGSREQLRQHNLPQDAFAKIPKYACSAIKTHTDPTNENVDVLVKNGVKKVLVMYRDPRDVAVSSYYYALKNNPWLPTDEHYKDYSTVSKEEGLSHSVDLVINACIPWIRGWIDIANTRKDIEFKFVKYEDLLSESHNTFKDIVKFFEIDMSDDEVSLIMYNIGSSKEKEKTLLMLPGQKTTKRKGIAGQWKGELSIDQKAKIKKHAGNLLVELGYENSLKW